MKLNFQGRVNNIVLPHYRALLPVFETLINSFHAIEESGRKDGLISLHVHRDIRQERQAQLIGGGFSSRQITGFTVEDNGVGFHSGNFDSFETSDTDYKKARGAKGVGRFMWLKAFDAARVSSIYSEGGQFYERTFDFTMGGNGISAHSLSHATVHDWKTRVELRSFLDTYEAECPRRAETIAERVIEHCLSYFMNESCPQVQLRDDDEDAIIILNERYRQEIETQAKRATIRCGNVILTINHVRVFAGEFSQHMLHLCARKSRIGSSQESKPLCALNTPNTGPF